MHNIVSRVRFEPCVVYRPNVGRGRAPAVQIKGRLAYTNINVQPTAHTQRGCDVTMPDVTMSLVLYIVKIVFPQA